MATFELLFKADYRKRKHPTIVTSKDSIHVVNPRITRHLLIARLNLLSDYLSIKLEDVHVQDNSDKEKRKHPSMSSENKQKQFCQVVNLRITGLLAFHNSKF